MNIIKTLQKAAAPIAIGALIASTFACNEDNSGVTAEYITPSNVAVKSFKLNSDSKVAENLDSVFFSIDLKNGVIFNADSLPVGTKINKLVATIECDNTVTGAIIKMDNGTATPDSIDYKKTQTDSIDFTKKVTLTLTTSDPDIKRTYLIKVNVHKEKSDSIVWGDRAAAQLPSRFGNPVRQKSVNFNGKAVTLIEENNGEYTLATSSDLYHNTWSRTKATFSFTPDVRSLSASTEALYILDKDGNLYTSAAGDSWTATGEKWATILGGYTETVIGVKSVAGTLQYAQHPLKKLNQIDIDSEFPVSGSSNFVTMSNKWTNSPVGFFVGGVKRDGTLSRSTWAFDGTNWVKLSESGMPALKGASIIPYYGYRFTQSDWKQTEYPVWMLVGGVTADNTLNRTVFISYDNAVNWSRGNTLLQLPKDMPDMTACDNVVMTTSRSAFISDYWKKASRTRGFIVDGDKITWDCPYIYIIGGESADGKLYDTVWRGVLARLTFTPLF